jgi:hypothetical protein
MLILFELRENFQNNVGILFIKWMIRLAIKYYPHIKFDQNSSLKANSALRRNYWACSV